jgi:RNA polymerase sigma-70 factor (ECF subfamily)
MAVRARAHVHVDRPRYAVPREVGKKLAHAFFDACKTGDVTALSSLLAEGATLHSDGGGNVYNVLNIR